MFDLNELMEFPCPTCDATGFVDHRYLTTGFVTAEPGNIHMKFCPECNGTGQRIGLPNLHVHTWEEFTDVTGKLYRECLSCPIKESVDE